MIVVKEGAAMLRPLEGKIEVMKEFEGGPDPMAYWTRGHVDKVEFAAEVRTWLDEQHGIVDFWDHFPYTENDVAHVFYRNVPAGPDFPGQMLMYPCKPGRGAYPVTIIDIDKSCQNYRYEQLYAAAPAK